MQGLSLLVGCVVCLVFCLMAGLFLLLFLFPQLSFSIFTRIAVLFSQLRSRLACLSCKTANRGSDVFCKLNLVTASNVISCWLISSPGMGISLGWLRRQNADEWQGSDCWVSGGEQQPFATSPVAPAVTNGKGAHFGKTPAVAGRPSLWKTFIQKVFHKRQKRQRELLILSQVLTGKTQNASQCYLSPFLHARLQIRVYACASGMRRGAKAPAPASCACRQCNMSGWKSRVACTVARAKQKNKM